MKELLIAACLLVFVVVRIKNIRAQGGYGVFAFPSVRPTKYFTTVYPGYIGGSSKDRRRILRNVRPILVPYSPKPVKDKSTWNHKAVLRNAFPPKKECKTPAWPLRQKMKRCGAHLPSPAELKGLFRRVGRQA